MKEAKQLFLDYKGDLDYLRTYKDFDRFDIPLSQVVCWKNEIIDKYIESYLNKTTAYYDLIDEVHGILIAYNDVKTTNKIIVMAGDELREIDLFLWEMIIKKLNEIIHSLIFSYNKVCVDDKKTLIESLEGLIVSILDPASHVNDYVYGHICKKYDLGPSETKPLDRIKEVLTSLKDIKAILNNADDNQQSN